MIGVYTGISFVFGTVVGWIGKVILRKGHPVEWYTYMENNGCPPPTYSDFSQLDIEKYLGLWHI
jgi:hypothetical protein